MEQKAYQDFDAHWHENKLDVISVAKQAEAQGFLSPLLERIQAFTDPVKILDVGCGDGVHAFLLGKSYPECMYRGLDLSLEATKVAHLRMQSMGRQKFWFEVGDAFFLPYPSASFDSIISYGVIAYTGNPEGALDEMMRVCKPEGLIGIWIYPKTEGLGGTLFNFVRSICKRLGRNLSKIVVYPIVLLLPILPVRSGANLFNSSWSQCVEVVEVNLLPPVLEFYTLDEVLKWFQKRKIKIEFIDPERPIAVWGRKSS
jgi:ubiquinone/menaquinone biosynthesis C-methylase UbiE